MSSSVSPSEVRSIVEAVLAELGGADASQPSTAPAAGGGAETPVSPAASVPAPAAPRSESSGPGSPSGAVGDLVIDVPDPTVKEERRRIGVENPAN
ncbi:MAG TPA: ethanolamine ammonia-lyase, partial [Nocardioidaceae bacterium]|nr:ethanolamine ammonia-lyase [Nocardioidaceae bacterium]